MERRATSKHHAWYELQQPQTGIFEAFEKPKIVWPDIARRCEFTIDESGAYIDMTLFTIPQENYYLLGILNSSVTEWFIQNISSSIQQGFLRFKRVYVSQIPIPTPEPERRADIESLVRRLLDAKGQGPQVEEWERELNELVYGVYRLNRREIAMIEDYLEFQGRKKELDTVSKALNSLRRDQ